jgi:hypothetical protein
MTPLDAPHATAAPQGFDVALIQAQLAVLALAFFLVIATMYRGSAFHDDGWHLVRVPRGGGRTRFLAWWAGSGAWRGRARARALFRDPRRPPTLKAPLSSPTNATAQPMIVALTFSTYLKLQGLTKSAKDAR